jgi:spoIIIJ-associated protein
MEWVETTGRSVDEAKDAALDQLGVDESDAEFVVMSEPRPGLFGRLRGEARVRARVRPTSPRPKRGRSRRTGSERSVKRSNGGSARSGSGSGSSVAVADREDLDDDDGNGQVAALESAVRSESSAPSAPSSKNARRRSRSRGGRSGAGRASDAPDTPPDSAEEARGSRDRGASTRRAEGSSRSSRGGQSKEEVVGEELSVEEQGESAREFVDGLVGMLGLTASVTMKVVDSDTAQVSVEGPGLGILIGPGGGTLGAIQELARTVVQKQTGGRSERILVDVAGYRAKRAAALQRFTKQIAEEVLSSAAERALEPMSASDRKVVHDTVNEMEGVVTRSVGEEPRRYIIVAPEPAAVPASEAGAEDG